MLNSEIYESALRLLGESLNEGENEDYKESAAFLIAAFCNDTERLDDSIRRFCGLSERPYFNPVWVSLDDEFPVSEKLAPMETVLSTKTNFILKKYKDHGTIMAKPAKDERELLN